MNKQKINFFSINKTKKPGINNAGFFIDKDFTNKQLIRF